MANVWQYVVCVLDGLEDANTFGLAWDGTNYGAIVLDEVMVFDAVLTQLNISDLHWRTRQGHIG